MSASKDKEKDFLPCPFCGHHPYIVRHADCSLWLLKHDCLCVGSILQNYATYQDLLNRWNNRVP